MHTRHEAPGLAHRKGGVDVRSCYLGGHERRGGSLSPGQENLPGEGTFKVGLRRWVIPCEEGHRLAPGGSEGPAVSR